MRLLYVYLLRLHYHYDTYPCCFFSPDLFSKLSFLFDILISPVGLTMEKSLDTAQASLGDQPLEEAVAATVAADLLQNDLPDDQGVPYETDREVQGPGVRAPEVPVPRSPIVSGSDSYVPGRYPPRRPRSRSGGDRFRHERSRERESPRRRERTRSPPMRRSPPPPRRSPSRRASPLRGYDRPPRSPRRDWGRERDQARDWDRDRLRDRERGFDRRDDRLVKIKPFGGDTLKLT